MKIVTIIGTRPQIIKAAPVSNELRKKHKEVLVRTGQHYNREMSDDFLRELFPSNYIIADLKVGSASHAVQTGYMMKKIEAVLVKEKPECVLVYGDTNSTLAGAVTAAKLKIPVAHVEAGMRSFDMTMPEEVNRVVTDRLSSIFFCSTETAVKNLKKEGITDRVYKVGDVMKDALMNCTKMSESRSEVLKKHKIKKKHYYLLTIHRAINTDNIRRLKSIMEAMSEMDLTVIFPVHPRTRKIIEEKKIRYNKKVVKAIKPVGYLDMLMLEKNAKKIITDSGGVQKEAYILGTPCITIRDATEWIKTIEAGWNTLVEAESKTIVKTVKSFTPDSKRKNIFGDGKASGRISSILNRERKK